MLQCILWYDYYPWDLIDIDKYTSILQKQNWLINIEHIVHYPPYKCRYNVQQNWILKCNDSS